MALPFPSPPENLEEEDFDAFPKHVAQEWRRRQEVLVKLLLNHPGDSTCPGHCSPQLREASDGYREDPLPFPRQPLRLKALNRTVEEFVIPESRREEVLKALYPFLPIPALDDIMFDLHEGRHFRVRLFRVVREANINMLVSPFYDRSGGSVIDWMPVSQRTSQRLRRQGLL